jgi:hypothetical protein
MTTYEQFQDHLTEIMARCEPSRFDMLLVRVGELCDLSRLYRMLNATCHHLAFMRLVDLKWWLSAAISACNTGSGKVSRAEGVMSLARAFMAAGASSVTVGVTPVISDRASVLHRQMVSPLRLSPPTPTYSATVLIQSTFTVFLSRHSMSKYSDRCRWAGICLWYQN